MEKGKTRRGGTGCILSRVDTVGVNEEVTLSQGLKDVREILTISTGRVLQAEGMASAKALGWEDVWCVRGRTRPVELAWS